MSVFEQAVLPVADERTFGEVAEALSRSFSPGNVDDFLHRVKKAGLRARDFEGVLRKGLLGKDVPAKYAALGNGDQGQVRERYLWLVEQVPQDLRGRYLKVYAYY